MMVITPGRRRLCFPTILFVCLFVCLFACFFIRNIRETFGNISVQHLDTILFHSLVYVCVWFGGGGGGGITENLWTDFNKIFIMRGAWHTIWNISRMIWIIISYRSVFILFHALITRRGGVNVLGVLFVSARQPTHKEFNWLNSFHWSPIAFVPQCTPGNTVLSDPSCH